MQGLFLLLCCGWSWADAPGEPALADGVSALTPPVLLTPVTVSYPADADLGEVSVALLLLVDEGGAVERVDVTGGEEPFLSAAVAAAQALRFTPALEAGQPVAVELPFSITFVPPVASAPPPEVPPERPPEVPPVAPPPPPPPADGGLLGTWGQTIDAPLVRVLTDEEIRVMPGTLDDPVRAVQSQAGLVRTPLDAGWLLVRGGAPEDTGLYLDGLRVPLVYHLGGLTSVLHPAMVDQVQFSPSGYPTRYGRNTAGMVDLQSRRAGRELRAQIGADTVAAGAYVEAPVGDTWGVAASARRSYLDAILNLVPGVTEEQSQVAPRFWDFAVRADGPRAGVFGFGYADSIDAPEGEDNETVTITLGTTRLQGRLELPVGMQTLQITPFIARNWSSLVTDTLDDLRAETVGGGRVELADTGLAPVGVTAGLDVLVGNYELEVLSLPVGGPYASVDPYVDLRVGQRTQLLAGVRAETWLLSDQLLRVAPTARLGAVVPIDEAWELRGDLGLYHQPAPMALSVGYPGGPYLDLERSWGGGLGVGRAGPHLRLDVDGWGRRLSDLAGFEDDGTLGEGEGVAWGLDTSGRVRQGPFLGMLTWTWSRSLRQNEPGAPWLPYTFDQPHVLSTTGAVELPRAWTLALRWRYASGFPRDPDVTEAYDILRSEERSLEDYEERLPAFHALDLKLSRAIVRRGWSLDGYLDIQNVYNRRIPEPAITGVMYQETVYTYGLPILPIFGVQGHYKR